MIDTARDLKLVVYLGSRMESLEVLLSSERVEEVVAIVPESSLCYEKRDELKKEYDALGSLIAQKTPKSLGLGQIEKVISENAPDLIVSVGCPYILRGAFVTHYENCIFNVHPHILPERPGWNPVKESYDSGEVLYGATLHHMTEEMDGGEKVAETRIRAHFDDIRDLYQLLFSDLEPSLLYMALKYKLIPRKAE